MQGLFEEGMQQFITYEKDVEGKKSRHQKKYQKIQKLKHDMNDPQLKKQRHAIRRAQDKNKLKKQLEGLNEQQARKYLDQKKLKKKQARERAFKAIKEGQLIFIDIVFQKKMNEKQNKSLAIQIQLIMKAIKHMQQPPGIHLCSVGGVVYEQLKKMGHHYWTLQSHTQDVSEVAKTMNKKLVYLSPDAPQPLQSVDIDTAYVIGGLVDRSVIKNASYYRAAELEIPARHLPIRQFMKGRSCLNLDHVVMILGKFKQCGNWKQAFEYGAPKRWAKKQGEFSLRNLQKQSQQQQQAQQPVSQKKTQIKIDQAQQTAQQTIPKISQTQNTPSISQTQQTQPNK